MRVLQIHFKNLNSLVGEWQIDLTHPAFVSDGIFVITGPTGAGKTTILDGICLALYGRTPRLNKVTKSTNEIMSRRTGECFAAVTFETQTGRYRCHWSQRRARERPAGELQAPKHEISNAASGVLLEYKIREVANRVESVTGMDFDRFTRSMLLAQGSFAAFLQAAPDERSPILEQITGTEIYSQISIRVHERQREEREKLDRLQFETAGIAILEPEQEKEIEQALDAKQKEEADLVAKSAKTAKAIEWLTAIDDLKKEVVSLDEEESELKRQMEAFKPDRAKLDRAVSAASLDGIHATLSAARKQQEQDKAGWKAEKEALPGLASATKEQAEKVKAAEQKTTSAKAELKAAVPELRKIRALDHRLANQEKAFFEVAESCRKDEANIDTAKKNQRKEQTKRAESQEMLECIGDYLKKHAQDEQLIRDLAVVEEKLSELISKKKEVIQKEAEHERAAKALGQAEKSLRDQRKEFGIRKRELQNATSKLQRGEEDLSQLLGDRSLREYRDERETLLREKASLLEIASFEDHRAQLEDGEPCPLCGATEHPFAEGNVPVPDETEEKIDALTRQIARAESQEDTIKELKEAESRARSNMAEAEKQEIKAAGEKETAETALAQVTGSLEKLRTDFVKRKQAISADLRPFGIADIPATDIKALVKTLRSRLKAWQDQARKKVEIEKQIIEVDGVIREQNAVIKAQSKALAEKRRNLETLREELSAGRDERSELYGDKDPDDEESRLSEAISDAESAERQVGERHNDLRQKWNTTKAHVRSLKKRIDEREPELTKLGNEFSVGLARTDFSNEEQFLQAKLPSEQKVELEVKARDLDKRQTDLTARQKDRRERLAATAARKVTEKSLEELEPQSTQHEESLNDLRNIIADLQNKLRENADAKERIREQRKAIEAQEKEYRRWDNLHGLIGSSDGKKYRNFAQSLTFERMIVHANQQLQKMTDRYLLVRDEDQPLELNVVDNYQAGEIRSTKNLSGGEGFIVSLSLALGLSHMASRNVRVDSLFLDEGFGTLDEEALNTALETLASLQQDGKLIGVISHVPALKERIGAQIQVIPQTGGRSQISGPGCGGTGSV